MSDDSSDQGDLGDLIAAYSGALPDGWVEVPLSELTGLNGLMCDGDWVETKDQDARGDVRLIQLADVGDGNFRDRSNRFLTLEKAGALNCTFLQKGDVLISRMADPLGRACLMPLPPQPCVTVVDVCVFRSGSDGISQSWIAHSINSPEVRGRILRHSSGTTRTRISSSKLKKLHIRVPPSAEQERIVAKLDELLSDIEAGEKALERARVLIGRYRQSVLKAAVTGELTRDWREKNLARLKAEKQTGADLLADILTKRREAWEAAELSKMRAKGQEPRDDRWKARYKEPSPPDTSSLSKLPEGWVWARAEQVCDFITKGTTPSSNDMSANLGEVPYIKVYNLTFDAKLDFSVSPTFIKSDTHRRVLARSVVYPGDVLMNIVGPPLGKVSIVPNTFPEWNINQAIAIFRPIPGLDREFLAQTLLTDCILSWAVSRAKATVGQFNLTLEICRDLPLPIPPPAEQEEMVRSFSEKNEAAQAAFREIERASYVARRLTRSLLHTAFCGKLTPQDPADEPASELLTRIRAERDRGHERPSRPKPAPSPVPHSVSAANFTKQANLFD